MVFCILGAGGFIGNALATYLIDKGHSIKTYDKNNINKLGDRHIDHYVGDFSTEDRWSDILLGVDVCYHFISTSLPSTSNENPQLDVEGNIIGTIRLLDALKNNVNVKLIFSSSGGTVYGFGCDGLISESDSTNPICSYGITKLSIEKYLYLYNVLYGVKSLSLRISNPYGMGQMRNISQGIIGVFLSKIKKGEKLTIWGDGSIIRDYLYIDDLVSALYTASLYTGNVNVMNVGSGIGTSINNILDVFKEHFNDMVVEYEPKRLFDVQSNVLNISLIQNELGWKPEVSIFNGISKIIEMNGFINKKK